MVANEYLRRMVDDATREGESDSASPELAASLAHEVSQPLTAMIVNAQACLRLLTEEQPNLERARKAAERIVRDGWHARNVIQSIRTGSWKSRRDAPVDINAVITEALELMDEDLRTHEVKLETTLCGEPCATTVDPVRVQQVILNLVRNGIEAMIGQTGRPRLLRVRCRRDEEGSVLISIADSGSGLDASTMARMFEPFFTTKGQGTGLGLSICRAIVRSHGGRLWASPCEPHGSTFYFTVPAA